MNQGRPRRGKRCRDMEERVSRRKIYDGFDERHSNVNDMVFASWSSHVRIRKWVRRMLMGEIAAFDVKWLAERELGYGSGCRCWRYSSAIIASAIISTTSRLKIFPWLIKDKHTRLSSSAPHCKELGISDQTHRQ